MTSPLITLDRQAARLVLDAMAPSLPPTGHSQVRATPPGPC